MIFTKTPTYSLKIIADAFKKQDLLRFEQHIDIDSIFDKGYSSLIMKYAEKEGKTKDLNEPLVAGLIQMMKPVAINTWKTVVDERIKKTFADNSTNKEIDKIKISKLKEESVVENNAVVSFEIEKEKEKHFVKLKMQRLENKEWKITEIINIADFVDQFGSNFKPKI